MKARTLRTEALRAAVVALRAEGKTFAQIGGILGVSTTTAYTAIRLPILPPDPPTPTVCRNCGRAKVNRPRGLCWGCYYTAGVREKFTSTSKYARRGVSARRGNRPLPTPTTATPGTPEKVGVLFGRSERGERLWHPSDRQAETPVERVEVAVVRVHIGRRPDFHEYA